MEWTVPVNEILSDKITKLNYTLIPPGLHGDVRSVRVVQDSLCKLIDHLGYQSSNAQGLNKVITTADKLRNAPTHILYLLKDSNAKGGKGEVIGFIKVGQKHLFLFDERGKVCEVEPYCVLDFYVLPDRQRHGYGKILFDHMLLDSGMSTEKLAIDGPSPKMEQFLRKNYGIEKLILQKNNFAVSPQFFNALPEISKSGRVTPVAASAVGRFAAHKPRSDIATIIHGGGGGGAAYDDTNDGTTSATASPDADGAAVSELDQHVAGIHISDAKTEIIDADENGAADKDKSGTEELAEQQKSPERPSTLKVEPVLESSVPAEVSPAGSICRRDSQLTDRGYFDIKFYHNKLW